MYGKERFLANNLITSVSMMTAGSQAGGVVSGVEKTRGTGTASAYAVGSFSGAQNINYTVQIDSVTPGTSVGQATFRWKTSLSTGWEATGVTTSSALQTLNYTVQIAFVSTGGTDFALDDTFQFFAVAKYGTSNALDLNINSKYRTGATLSTVIDFGSETTITAFALVNHNLVAGQSTLNLQGNASNAWGAPTYNNAITVTDTNQIEYLNQKFRYWRILPADGALTYFQAGEIYLGTYLQLEKNAWWGSSRGYGYATTEATNAARLHRKKSHGAQAVLTLDYDIQSANDIASLVTLQQALIDSDTGKVNPVFVNLFSDVDTTLFLCDWRNIQDFTQIFSSYNYNGKVQLQFTEAMRV